MSLTPGGGTLGSSRCGHCGGSVRVGAPWCTLCLTPTGPAGGPEPLTAPEQVPPVTTSAGEIDPLTAPLELVLGATTTARTAGTAVTAAAPAAPTRPRHAAAPTWPCTSCSTENALELTTCVTCGAGFLAAARNDAPLLALPVVGDITRLGRGQRFALAAGVAFVFLLLTFLVGLLLG